MRHLPPREYEDEDWSEYDEEELATLDQVAMAYNRGIDETRECLKQALSEMSDCLAVVLAGRLLEKPYSVARVAELIEASDESISAHDASTMIALASNLRESMELSPITNVEELTDAIINQTTPELS